MLTVTIRPVGRGYRNFELLVQESDTEVFYVTGLFASPQHAAIAAAEIFEQWATIPKKNLPAGLYMLAHAKEEV